MSLDPVLGWLATTSAWLEMHAPLHVELLALTVLLLLWWKVRHPREEIARGECRSCGEGYRLQKLKPTAQDGAQMCVKCPTCAAWYAVATTSRDVFKVDEGYVFARWPSLQKQ
jgi:hypothetical protein